MYETLKFAASLAASALMATADDLASTSDENMTDENMTGGVTNSTNATDPAIGHNSGFTDAEVDKLAASVADKLAKAVKQGENAEKGVENSKTLMAEAYAAAHQYYEHLGLPKGDEGGGKVYRANGNFVEFNQDVARALSKKLGDKVETTEKGKEIFSGRVKKQVSRMVVAYREDAEGTQSEADERNKEIAKMKRNHQKQKSEVFDQMVGALKSGDQEAFNAVVPRAVTLYDTCEEELANV